MDKSQHGKGRKAKSGGWKPGVRKEGKKNKKKKEAAGCPKQRAGAYVKGIN